MTMSQRALSAYSILLLLISQFVTTLYFTSSVHTVNAQAFQPAVTTDAGSDYIDGQAMYIMGGTPSVDADIPTPQSFMIDLSVSWNATSPAFRKLPNNPGGSFFVIKISTDGQSLLALIDNGAYLYNIKTFAWTTILTSPNIMQYNLKGAAADPESGYIYVPNAYSSTAGNITSMLRINLQDSTFTSVPMYRNATPQYATAWSSSQKSLFNMGELQNDLHTYNPTNGWTALTSTLKGIAPVPRNTACMVSAYGGSKMILFGGYNRFTIFTALRDIHILDVATMTWSSGPNITDPSGRMGAACAFSNDQFLVWGGKSSNLTLDVLATNTVLIYNMKTNAWVTTYTAPIIPTATFSNSSTQTGTGASSMPPGSATDTPGPSSSITTSSRMVVILGAVIGVLVLAFGVTGFILYRVRAKQGASRKENNSKNLDDPSIGLRVYKKDVFDRPARSHVEDSMFQPRSPTYPPPPANAYWAAGEFPDRTVRNPAAIVNGQEYAYPSPSSSTSARPSSSTDDQRSGTSSSRMGGPHLGAHGSQRFSQHPHAIPVDSGEIFSSPGVYYAARPYAPPPPPPSTGPRSSKAGYSAYHIPGSDFQ